MNPKDLKPDKSLGKGSMFHVRREIYDEGHDPPLQYYVAVKYMRGEDKPQRQRQITQSLLRELRVLTHPQIRGYPHIFSAFSYEWTGSIMVDPKPYLVMEYADFGTLAECLRAIELQRHVTMQERHRSALDIACGLQALHENGILYGDFRADNVLLCQQNYPLSYTLYEVSNFIVEFALVQRSLVIVYYSGYCREVSGESQWAAKRAGGPTLIGSDTQSSCFDAIGDVLLILDCCHVTLFTKSRKAQGKFEVLVACAKDLETPPSGEESFTWAFLKVFCGDILVKGSMAKDIRGMIEEHSRETLFWDFIGSS